MIGPGLPGSFVHFCYDTVSGSDAVTLLSNNAGDCFKALDASLLLLWHLALEGTLTWRTTTPPFLSQLAAISARNGSGDGA